MTPAQSSAVLAKVAEALKDQGMLNSSNLLDLMPKIVELVQKNLKEAELDQNGDQITRVVKNMLGTLISKMNGKEAFMTPSSAEPGLTVQTTLLKQITSTSISNLGEAFEAKHSSARSNS